LIIDERGYMPITKEQANLLFQLISMRYERGSIILTSNYNFEDWGKVFQDDVVAAAIIDRLVHHAKIFYINGTSYRLKNKLKKPSYRGSNLIDYRGSKVLTNNINGLVQPRIYVLASQNMNPLLVRRFFCRKVFPAFKAVRTLSHSSNLRAHQPWRSFPNPAHTSLSKPRVDGRK
jgi:hypothetical protein